MNDRLKHVVTFVVLVLAFFASTVVRGMDLAGLMLIGGELAGGLILNVANLPAVGFWSTAELDVYGVAFGSRVSPYRNTYGLDFTLFGGGTSGDMDGLEIGLFATGLFEQKEAVNRVNGIQISTLIGDTSVLNGITVAGVMAHARLMNGLQIGGVGSVADDFNGLQLGGLGSVSETGNGLQLGGAFARMDYSNGAQIAAVNIAEEFNGLQIGAVNFAKEFSGLQIGAVNITGECTGMQVGVINVIRRSQLPFMPVVNMEF